MYARHSTNHIFAKQNVLSQPAWVVDGSRHLGKHRLYFTEKNSTPLTSTKKKKKIRLAKDKMIDQQNDKNMDSFYIRFRMQTSQD